MKKLLVIALAMALVMVGGVMAADTAATGASVSINELIDISITPCAGGIAESISYGGQYLGATNVKPVACNNATDGDLKVTVEATTNVPVTVKISGTD